MDPRLEGGGVTTILSRNVRFDETRFYKDEKDILSPPQLIETVRQADMQPLIEDMDDTIIASVPLRSCNPISFCSLELH